MRASPPQDFSTNTSACEQPRCEQPSTVSKSKHTHASFSFPINALPNNLQVELWASAKHLKTARSTMPPQEALCAATQPPNSLSSAVHTVRRIRTQSVLSNKARMHSTNTQQQVHHQQQPPHSYHLHDAHGPIQQTNGLGKESAANQRAAEMVGAATSRNTPTRRCVTGISSAKRVTMSPVQPSSSSSMPQHASEQWVVLTTPPTNEQ